MNTIHNLKGTITGAMNQRTGPRFGTAAFIGLLALQLTSCGAPGTNTVPSGSTSPPSMTIRPDGAAKSVVDVVSRQTGFHPADVRCPSGVKAKAGGEFDCRFTGPEGKPYTAHMRITEVDGERVEFDVESRPS